MPKKIHKLKIGNITLDNNMFLAPMAGITDLPTRILAKEGGAGLVYTEMVSARGLVYANVKTKKLLQMQKKERPVSVQIFGGDAYSMGESAKYVEDFGADIVDINLGCPVRKVAKAGAGAKLLANEVLTADILETVVKSVKIPVTIKIRIGLVPNENIAPQIIKIAQNSGVKLVCVHARYASFGHGGEPDLSAFAKACQNATIPIIANGGIIDEITAEKFLNIPNCSGIMIGRGAIGNYSIFNRIKSYINDGLLLPKPTAKEKIEYFKKHVKASMQYYGEQKGLVVMRKVSAYYLTDLPNASRIRNEFNMLSDRASYEAWQAKTFNLLSK